MKQPERIRKRIGKEITIIVLTSYEFSEIEEAKAAGVDAFIAKTSLFPFDGYIATAVCASGGKEKTARNYLDELSEADYTGKILLVEDNELNREIAVRNSADDLGAEVETAENGKIAVEKSSPRRLV